MKNLILLLISFSALFSQQFNISGVIIDKNNVPVIGANAVLLNSRDSSIISGVSVNLKGEFELKNISIGSYILKTSSVGFKEKFKNIKISNADLNLGKIFLDEKIISIGEVQIKATIPPATLEGDTASYSSKAYKTNPDATTEDLVAKIPGVTVEGNKVQAQGEDVKKVLVDGRPFFGDDPTAILRNLPSEVVDKVQIFDDKSEQSKFTGFDDGNTTKTMNIVTRPQFRNGTFGKFSTMYGEDEKYKVSSVLNFFNDSQRITFLAQSNNINEQNFSAEDIVGAFNSGQSSGGMQVRSAVRSGGGGASGGRMIFQSGGGNFGGDLGQFLVDPKNGLTKTNAIGLNFSDKFFDKIDLSGSYFYNYSDNNSISELARQYITSSTISSFNYNENTVSENINANHRLNMKIDFNIDSSNSILFQPRLSLQDNGGESNIVGENFSNNIKTSNTINYTNPDLIGMNFSGSTLFRHKFEKPGRTLSINLNPQYNFNNGTSINKFITNNIFPNVNSDTVNQKAELDKNGKSINSNIIFTEPLSKEHFISLRVENSIKNNFSDKKTNDFFEDDYTLFDTLLSNKFNSTTTTIGSGIDYQFKNDDLTMITGVNFQKTNLKNDQSFPKNYLLNENYTSILPSLMITYKFTKTSNLRFNYRASTNIPSVDQLQEVLDNSRPLQLSIGNSALKEEKSNFINLRFMNINPAKNSTFFIFAGGNFSDNYVANSIFFAEKDTVLLGKYFVPAGTRFYSPINLNGQYSLRAFSLYGFMLPFINANLNISAFANYSNIPGLINNQINYAKSPSLRLNFTISSSISEKLDYTFSSGTTFNETKNSLQKESDRNYQTQITRFKINILPFGGLVLTSDVSHNANYGLSENYSNNFILWNAGIGYKFLQNNRAEIKFTVNDILNQNKAVNRTTTDSYFEDVKSNVLQRYFILSFSYNLRSFADGERNMMGGFNPRH